MQFIVMNLDSLITCARNMRNNNEKRGKIMMMMMMMFVVAVSPSCVKEKHEV